MITFDRIQPSDFARLKEIPLSRKKNIGETKGETVNIFCGNSNCFSRISFIYMGKKSKTKAVQENNWRFFSNVGIVPLCPYCAEIQQDRDERLKKHSRLYRKNLGL